MPPEKDTHRVWSEGQGGLLTCAVGSSISFIFPPASGGDRRINFGTFINSIVLKSSQPSAIRLKSILTFAQLPFLLLCFALLYCSLHVSVHCPLFFKTCIKAGRLRLELCIQQEGKRAEQRENQQHDSKVAGGGEIKGGKEQPRKPYFPCCRKIQLVLRDVINLV